MTRGRLCLFLALTSFASLGASHRTPNFVVEAPDEEIARKIGESAERYRKEFAVKWLGEEMPRWEKRCPLKVTVTDNASGGATSFAFERGAILRIDMHIEGKADRLVASVLPHEITHTVFAYYFRAPVPRWADEGGSILSEDEKVRREHDNMVRKILQTPGRAIPLRRLFPSKDYPRDIMVLYAEGYSVSRFLVEANDRKTFLAFVAEGMKGDWDKACEKHYDFATVEEMEKAWLKWLRANDSQGDKDAAKRRIEILEAEVKLLKLEKQLLRAQLTETRRAAESKSEQERLQEKIRRASRALEKLRRSEKPLPSFPPLTGEPAPFGSSPGLVVPAPAKP
ncbi:MAG TPA: hypothetical protein VH643_13750 [Gemmataceae bacterium]|jgi:hypothetical protein